MSELDKHIQRLYRCVISFPMSSRKPGVLFLNGKTWMTQAWCLQPEKKLKLFSVLHRNRRLEGLVPPVWMTLKWRLTNEGGFLCLLQDHSTGRSTSPLLIMVKLCVRLEYVYYQEHLLIRCCRSKEKHSAV